MARCRIVKLPGQFQVRLGHDGEWLTSLAPFERRLNMSPADQIAAAALYFKYPADNIGS